MDMKGFKDIVLSGLGMGNMRLPVTGRDPSSPIDYKKAQEIIDYAMKSGINYYDTAYIYHGGESEKFLGEAMKKYKRDSYYLATKYPISASPDYKAVFEEQLERLRTDYIDFYLIHAISDDTWKQYIDSGCIEYFAEQKEKGRIKYLGFSSHASVENLRSFADYRQWDFGQLQINYFDWSYADTKEEYNILTERNIPIMVMEPVRGGKLANLTPDTEAMLKKAHPEWSIAAWALRWVRRLPNVRVVLSGMSNLEQLKDNIRTFGDTGSLNDEDEKLLMEVCEKFHSNILVPCTSCRYCCDDCPLEINIPEYLELYNKGKTDGQWAIKEGVTELESRGKASDCIACGACTGHCPQNIDVPRYMQELTDILGA